jgi:hypothetical protein
MPFPRIVRTITIATTVLLAACSSGGREGAKKPAPPMAEAHRDSLIAASRLPGAAAVGKSLAIADSARARAARVDGETP